MSNENTNTNSEATESKIKRKVAWLDADGEATVLGIGEDIKPVAFIATYVDGEEVHRAAIGDFVSQFPLLAALGLRSVIQYAAAGAADADEVEQFISEKLASVANNQFSDRGGERGVNLESVARVVAHMTKKEYSDVLKALETAEKNMESEVFKKYIAQVRSNPNYKTALNEVYPDRKRRGRKASADPLAALGI